MQEERDELLVSSGSHDILPAERVNRTHFLSTHVLSHQLQCVHAIGVGVVPACASLWSDGPACASLWSDGVAVYHRLSSCVVVLIAVCTL